jgi:hypothetical protein
MMISRTNGKKRRADKSRNTRSQEVDSHPSSAQTES